MCNRPQDWCLSIAAITVFWYRGSLSKKKKKGKGLFYLKGRVKQRERHAYTKKKEIFHPLAFPQKPPAAEAGPEARTQELRVSYLGDRDPSTWALICHLPGCTLAGSWLRSEGATMQTRLSLQHSAKGLSGCCLLGVSLCFQFLSPPAPLVCHPYESGHSMVDGP